jgi:hypothetical protein
MNRQVSKPQIFWAPDLSTARKIDDSYTVTAIESARYRFIDSSKLRAAFVAEVAQLYQDSEAA